MSFCPLFHFVYSLYKITKIFSHIFFQYSFDFTFLHLGLDLAEIYFCLWYEVGIFILFFSKQVVDFSLGTKKKKKKKILSTLI